MLKELTLSGFKSFARESHFQFSSSITAIVGPNGSGKSNIAESVRFVLGEQSMKSLRSKKGEDLIFNGSKTVARLNRGSVAMVFDNKNRVLNIDYDEVELKRIIWRDGTSQYLINGSQVRLKDILELLAGVNIGASGHHIISQGEADRILNASIKERRAMIEDALGLRIYQYKKAESTRKLLKTKENIAHVEAIRREIAPHLAFLEKQVKKIEQSEALREDLHALYVEYLAHEYAYLEKQKRILSGQKHEPTTLLGQVEKQIQIKEKDLGAERETEQKNADMEQVEKTLHSLRQEKDALSRVMGRLEGIIEYESRKEKEAKNALPLEQSVIIGFEALKTLVDTIKSLVHDARSAEADKGKLASLLGTIEETVLGFWNTHGSTKDKLRNLQIGMSEKERAEVFQKKDDAGNRMEAIAKEEDVLMQKYTEARKTIDESNQNERLLERELYDLRTKKNECLSRIELLHVREEQLDTEKGSYAVELSDAKHFVKGDIDSLIQKQGFSGDEPRPEQEKRKRTIERLKIKIEETGGGGEEVLKEYTEVLERDRFLGGEIADLQKSAETLEGLIEELGEKINTEFKIGVQEINTHFQEYFSLMFDGGNASIKVITPPPKRKKEDELLDDEVPPEDEMGEELEEVEEGIDIAVNLPTKRIKSLQTLSGGERALTSISLIFAITQVHPPPFLILDETDAALDESNSKKFGDLVEKLSEKTQCIIITHNRATMAKAGVLYGVTAATDGVSRTLSIKLEKAVEMAQ
ncbi:MAG TPA: AAA family ATPase [Candidatus Paceibacterota bacterium]